MKRLLATITLIMAFGLTAYAGHNTRATPTLNSSAQSQAIGGYEVLAHEGHPA